MDNNDYSQDYGFSSPNETQLAPNHTQDFSGEYGLPSGSQSQAPTLPIDVRSAKEVTGQHDSDGLCESFVEKMAGLPNMGATAADAWNNWASQGKAFQGLQGARPGDLIYFSPNSGNRGAGHTAIYEGNNKMISATYQGVREDDVSDWNQNIAPLLGFVRPQ